MLIWFVLDYVLIGIIFGIDLIRHLNDAVDNTVYEAICAFSLFKRILLCGAIVAYYALIWPTQAIHVVRWYIYKIIIIQLKKRRINQLKKKLQELQKIANQLKNSED